MTSEESKDLGFSVGDVVWVLTDKSEEAAECLGINQVWVEDSDDDDDEDHEEDDDRKELKRNDGILVRFVVSKTERTFSPKNVRAMTYESDQVDKKRRSRRSTRSPASAPQETKQRTPTKPTKSPFFDSDAAKNRSVVTPSPKAAGAKSAEKKSVGMSPAGEDKEEKPSDAPKKRTRLAKAKPAKNSTNAAPKKKAGREQDKKAKATGTSTAGGKKKAKPSDDSAVVKNRKGSTAAKNAVPLICIPIEDDSHDEENQDRTIAQDPNGEPESDDDEDPVYRVEYSVSGRATCRTCDELIPKGALRVVHQPLFRGKPGFSVYRHLKCASFDADIITKARDVKGWNRIKKDDMIKLEERIVEARIEAEKEQKEVKPDELVQEGFAGEIRPSPPPGVTASLLPFQVEGFSWMRHQEKNDEAADAGACRGGILSDEMGMGKTLQTIAAICDNRPLLQHCSPSMKHAPDSPDLKDRVREEALWAKSKKEWLNEVQINEIPKQMVPRKGPGARAGTLVVCPVIALLQWKSEIAKFTENGSLSVGVYHGPNRSTEMTPAMMSKYDVILTTYQCLEQDFRKMVSPNKVTCPNCGGKFKMDKLRVHLRYFCGEGAQRTEAQARQRRSDNHRGGAGGGSRGSGGGQKGKKKPPAKKSKVMISTPQPAKKTIRLSRSTGYDSDSELSIDDETKQMATQSARPSRSAAKKASSKLSSSVKEWSAGPPEKGKGGSDGDYSSFGGTDNEDEDEDEDSSSETSEDEPISSMARKKKATAAKKIGGKRKATKITPAEEDDSDSEGDAVVRAREKQRKALENLQKGRKGKAKKASASKKESKRKGAGKSSKGGKSKRKKFDSSSSESDEDDEDDPLAGIDLDELAEEAMNGAKFSVLHSFCWWRIVLDEAHYIKSRSSQTAAAAFALTGVHRWCLSGTPLQNRVGELYSLIRFLQIEPHAHYFCKAKGCNCKSVHYKMKEGVCKHCGHRAFTHYSHFNRQILNVIQRDGYQGDGRRAMFLLKNEVLDKCLLRRTKETRAEDMNLPPRIVSIRTLKLHPKEEDFYKALYTSSRSSFDDYVAEGTLLNNYAHIFDLLTKMRQAVDHPYLIVYSKNNRFRELAPKVASAANGCVDCEMCHEPPTDRIVSSCCGAGYCRSCVSEYIESSGADRTPCPSCERPFSIDLNQQPAANVQDDNDMVIDSSTVPTLKSLSHVQTGSILRRINLAEFATSSKIEVLVQDLVEMRNQRPGSKALVFSQFVNMLDLIRWRIHSDPCLSELGLGVRILHGGMDVKSRDTAIKEFQNDSSIRVLLMSLKAGGVALNLTVASEVFLVDNWWNPAAEMQAIDRTHRLGQYRPIRAVRYIAEGTVEERVLQLQEKKRLVFDGTVGRDAGSLKTLTAEDMKALFC